MRTRYVLSPAAAVALLALCAAAAPLQIAGRDGGRVTLTAKAPRTQRGRWFVEFQEPSDRAEDSDRAAGPSVRGAADIDCAASQFKIAKYSVFQGPNFTGGLLLDLGQRADWRPARPGTPMERVLAAACGKAQVQARAPAARAAPPQLPPLKLASTASAARPAPKPAGPAEAAAPPVAPAAAAGDFYAQLASLPSQDAARQAWDALKGAAPGVLDDRLRRLTTAIVHGRRVFRVQAGGFETKAQAETVCKALVRLTAGCFVRPGEAAPTLHAG